MHLTEAARAAVALVESIERVIVGKRDTVEGAVVTLLSGGHLLLEDVPGVGKTVLAKSLAVSLGVTFKRVQFTPDLLPSDVTGVTVFDQRNAEFRFREGPVFTNVLLADEINRASPKTQSSLLECMEERQVTVDGVTHPLPQPFMVIATQNPLEYEGIYPLPESQLDRFMARLRLGYPSLENEKIVLKQQAVRHPLEALTVVVQGDTVRDMQQTVRSVHVSDEMQDYVLALVSRTRSHPRLHLGASPRGSLHLTRAAQARAVLRGRDYVLPDDVKGMAVAVLAHRLILEPEARLEGLSSEEVVQEILGVTPVAA
ncbi:MAG: AAA family ATPase [Armatimonadetes bacterium CG_4_9_14_3_um_filter_66_14]|nr:MoxR family ATPase [Armatimonadota bacterium]PIU89035.1 MAG: AAA family ATPase [Armatimonadetes bacterium CG06_land_8_20_14_3_00_66_21]PIX42548.1 MAG: AAA family ATPase [Armatimonadetes bacterium CG_4_8_14_3_um_filter_66_20]PJB73678.1 MAG: AAA family ATPase [Armatimonadetes bacterium CG_4_9_14_3_um_filter_66_14]